MDRQASIESFEAIAQDSDISELILRLANLSRAGRVASFVEELVHDGGVGPETSAAIAELARDPDFLNAFEDYVRRTRRAH